VVVYIFVFFFSFCCIFSLALLFREGPTFFSFFFFLFPFFFGVAFCGKNGFFSCLFLFTLLGLTCKYSGTFM